MTKKNLLVLGGSGGVGQWLVKLAVEQGYNVTMLIRASSRYVAPQGVEVIVGDVLDTNVLTQALKGQDAVVSALGIMRVKPNNPWSALASPPDLMTQVAQNLVSAMKAQSVERVVAISAAGVAESESQMSVALKLLIRSSNVRKTFADFSHMEDTFAQSGLDTLSIRPVGLVDKNSQRAVGIVDKFNLGDQISKRDVAHWMLQALDRPNKFAVRTEMIGWT
ncbi:MULTISPECIES: NAD(P)H-binding protein [Vibrio]|uniref:NAD(P)H-binding protein n=1 Tax=Vibrio TaxID=662 RepID=UPI003D0A5BB9